LTTVGNNDRTEIAPCYHFTEDFVAAVKGLPDDPEAPGAAAAYEAFIDDYGAYPADEIFLGGMDARFAFNDHNVQLNTFPAPTSEQDCDENLKAAFYGYNGWVVVAGGASAAIWGPWRQLAWKDIRKLTGVDVYVNDVFMPAAWPERSVRVPEVCRQPIWTKFQGIEACNDFDIPS